jgi:hypothetical protein
MFRKCGKIQTFENDSNRKFKNPLSSSLVSSNTNIELCEMFVVIDLCKHAKCIHLLCMTTESAVVTEMSRLLFLSCAADTLLDLLLDINVGCFKTISSVVAITCATIKKLV